MGHQVTGGTVASPQEPSGRETSLAPVLALLEGCSPHGLLELERVLTVRLRVETTPAQERVAALFGLAELLRSPLATRLPHHPIAKAQIERSVYDDLRPDGAPSSETLVRRFGGADHGGWLWALRAADGLLSDGRKRGGEGLPWPQPWQAAGAGQHLRGGRAQHPRLCARLGATADLAHLSRVGATQATSGEKIRRA